MSNKNNQPIPLFDEYKGWCKQNLTIGKSASDYPSRLQKINREFISTIYTGSTKQPLELLQKYLTSSNKGPKRNLIEDLLTAIGSCIAKELAKRKGTDTEGSFRSERTAFNKYVKFILQDVESKPYRKDKICPTEKAALSHISGDNIVLDQDSLLSIFTSRIGTQDRITGQKAFIPLGLLSKVCAKGDIHDWAKDTAEHVLIHTESGTVPVTDVEKLIIDTKSGDVTIKLKNDTREIVFNPPLNGPKKPMQINMISETDIDHDPDIHTVLIGMKGSLPTLEYIKDQILAAKDALGYSRIDSKNCDSIYEYLLKDSTFMTNAKQLGPKIISELNNVTSNHLLQLADAEWNRKLKKKSINIISSKTKC
ncbi:MAG: hypothetical protein NC217_04595 [Muribaculaceae bacterium]|nr:hypothetical protein [Muribaculaceae bacterium]